MTFLRSNRALLDAFRRGDREALRRVYDHYRSRVELLFRRGAAVGMSGARYPGVSRAECGDLIQEAFARAFSERSRLQYDGLHDYGPFLLGICRNVLSEWWRKRGREVPSEDIEQLVEESTPAFSDEERDPELLALAARYVSDLSPELAAVHTRRYVEGLSQRDAAEAIGIGRQQIRTLEAKLRGGLERLLRQPKTPPRAKDD